MTQGLRTAIYLAVALVVGVVAFATRPGAPTVELDEQVGDPLFPELTDAAQVASLEISKYDEAMDRLGEFKVALVDGVWSITSHGGYPADDVRETGGESKGAESRVADAAASLIDLSIVGVDSSSARDHVSLGVVEPDLEKMKIGAAGVGTLVVLQDAARQDLARLIIGKPVDDAKSEDAFGDQKKLHYVRRAGQDQVYRVLVDASKLSTTFGDWIKKDLLELDTYDIKQVTLNDYGVLDSERGGKVPDIRSLMTFDFKNNQWTLAEELVRTDDRRELKLEPAPLSPDEEPAAQKLNALKNALGELQIVDVVRKPAVLADLLRKGHPFPYQDPEQVPEGALESLQDHGFYFYPGEPPQGFTQLFSDAGDFFVRMNDGVEYLVRFGEVSTSLRSMSAQESEKESEDGGGNKVGLNRHVMVTARFNPDAIEKPVLTPYPDAAPSTGGEQEPLDAGQAPAGAEGQPPAESAAPAAPGEPGNETEDQDVGQTEPASSDEPPASEQPASDPSASEPPKEAPKLDPAAEARKMIDDANKKAQEAYEKKLKEGQEKVDKLNARFADWYFVVSEESYKKLRLGREEAIQKRGAQPADDSGPPDFGGPGFPGSGIPNFGPPM